MGPAWGGRPGLSSPLEDKLHWTLSPQSMCGCQVLRLAPVQVSLAGLGWRGRRAHVLGHRSRRRQRRRLRRVAFFGTARVLGCSHSSGAACAWSKSGLAYPVCAWHRPGNTQPPLTARTAPTELLGCGLSPATFISVLHSEQHLVCPPWRKHCAAFSCPSLERESPSKAAAWSQGPGRASNLPGSSNTHFFWRRCVTAEDKDAQRSKYCCL